MTSRPTDHQLFILEGNIGAGKSTLLKMIKDNLSINVIDEPLNKWQTINGQENLLDLFYKDTNRWAYTFQSYAFISRILEMVDQLKKSPPGRAHVLERSVYSDRFCFAKNCFESGLMTKLEWQIYKDWFDWLVAAYMPKPAGFIYIRTTPETSFKRLSKRSRHEESSVPLSYISALHEKHEKWLLEHDERPEYIKGIPVLTLECEADFENNTEEQDRHLIQIRSFMQGTQGTPGTEKEKIITATL